MAQYQFDERDDVSFSANKLRQEMEERIRQEEFQRYLRDIDKTVHTVTDPSGKMLERTIRKEINSDPIARETRSAFLAVGLVGSVAAGIALCVASGASDAAYNNHMQRAMNEYAHEQGQQLQRNVDSSMDRQTQKLSEHIDKVAEQRRELETSKQSYYVEYRETRNEAQQAIEAARNTYNQEKESIRKAGESADAELKRSTGAANEQYQKDVERIKTEYPSSKDQEAEIAKAASRRDSEIAKAENTHRDEMTRLKDRTAVAETNLNTTVNHQKDIIHTAQIKRDEGIAASRTNMSNAQLQLDSFQSQMRTRDDMERKVMSSVIQKGGKVDDYHGSYVKGNLDVKGEILAAGKGVAHMSMSEIRQHTSNAINNSIFNNGSSTEDRFVQTVMENHKNIGRDVARQLGSQEERQTLAAADALKQQRKQAQANGLPMPQDKDNLLGKAKDIEKKYTGSLSSEKDLALTLSTMKKSANELVEKNNRIQSSINTSSLELNGLTKQAAAIEKQIQQLHADHKMLETGKGANGVKLTADQRKEIAARVNGVKVGDLNKQLVDIKTKQNALTKEINGKKSLIAHNKNLVDGLNGEIQLLTKHGKAIINTDKSRQVTLFGSVLKDENGNPLIKLKDKNGNPITKKSKEGPNTNANRMQKKGISAVFKQWGKISRELKKDLNKGNALQNELMQTARKMNQLTRKYELALAVGNIAIQALGKAGAIIKKSGVVGKTFKLIGDKTRFNSSRLGTFLSNKLGLLKNNAKFQKFVKVSKITKNSGLAIGGKILRAPLSILRAPMKIMNAPQELAKGAAKIAWRTTRKITGVTVKGAKKVTKTVVKHTIGKTKFGKGVAKLFNSASNRINQFKQSVKALLKKPVQAIKKIIGKIIGVISSILSSLLSLLGTILAYLLAASAGLLFFVILILIIAALLLSIINAIWNWLESLGSEYTTYVHNHPNYILNQAVNYRYEELKMAESLMNSNLTPSIDPIQFSKTGWWMFLETGELDWFELIDLKNSVNGDVKQLGYDSRLDGVLLTAQNAGAYHTLNNLGKTFDEGYTYDLTNNFTRFLYNYDAVKFNYYPYSAYADGRINSNDVPSNYEISNAKDVLAMVDALYQDAETAASDSNNDKLKMQIHEVLAYLGVGAHAQRITDSDGSTWYNDNLFWKTHKIVYSKGTSTNDIIYHVSLPNTNNPDSYYVSSTQTYSNDGRYTAVGGAPISCDSQHKQTLTLQYTTTETTYRDVHTSLSNYDNEHCYEYLVDSDSLYGSQRTVQSLTPAQLYYYSSALDYWSASEGSLATSSCWKYNNNRQIAINKTLKHIGYNKKSNTDLASLYNMLYSDTSGRISFYEYSGNSFRVVDSNGYYLGLYNIKTNDGGKVYDMITKYDITNNDGTVTTVEANSKDGVTTLKAFYLMYDSSNDSFSFRVVGNPSYSGTKLSIQQSLYLNGSGTNDYFYYKLPYILGSRFTIDCSCPQIEETTSTPHTFTYQYCTGHISLDVGIVVTTIDDGDALFAAARNLDEFDEWSKSDNGEGVIFGIVIYSDDDYGEGFGSYTLRAFDPESDWAAGSEIIDVARTKAGVDHEYEVSDPSKFKLNEQSIEIVGTTRSLKLTNDNKLAMLIQFGSQSKWVYSFTSGEQRKLRVYNDDGTMSLTDIKVVNNKIQYLPSVN